MLTEKQYDEIRSELDNCKNPLFFFDDDQDGLCSFLLLRRFKGDGKGFIVKTTPRIDESLTRYVHESGADKVFILDIANVDQEFIDSCPVSVVWIDHHGPFKRDNVKYFNPRISGESQPTTFMAYETVKQDLWLATAGCVADWFIPPFMDEFEKAFPDLIGRSYSEPGDIIFDTELGKLIRILSFVLKGKSEDVKKSFNLMINVTSPYEILRQETDAGKFLYKRFSELEQPFQILRTDVLKQVEESTEKVVLYIYKDDMHSFTSDIANEMTYRFKDKIVIVGREKSGEMKCSVRSASIELPPIIEQAVSGLRGHGGGHEFACGLNVAKDDFDEFMRRFRELVDEAS